MRTENIMLASAASSRVSCFSIRLVGSKVVSQSCNGIISPSPASPQNYHVRSTEPSTILTYVQMRGAADESDLWNAGCCKKHWLDSPLASFSSLAHQNSNEIAFLFQPAHVDRSSQHSLESLWSSSILHTLCKNWKWAISCNSTKTWCLPLHDNNADQPTSTDFKNDIPCIEVGLQHKCTRTQTGLSGIINNCIWLRIDTAHWDLEQPIQCCLHNGAKIITIEIGSQLHISTSLL